MAIAEDTQATIDKLVGVVTASLSDAVFQEELSKKLTLSDMGTVNRYIQDFIMKIGSRIISSAAQQSHSHPASASRKRQLSTGDGTPLKTSKTHSPTYYNMYYSYKQKQYASMPMTGVEPIHPSIEWQFLPSGKVNRTAMYMKLTAADWGQDREVILRKLHADLDAAPGDVPATDVAMKTIAEWFANGETAV